MTRKLIPPTLGRCKGLSPSQSNSSNSKPPNDAPITEFEYDNSAAPPADASDSVDILGATIKGFPLDDAISIVENTMQSDNTRHAQDVEMIDQVAVLVEDVEDLRDDLSQDRDDNVAPTLDTREDEDGEYEDGVFSDDDDRDGEDAQGNTQRKEESQTTSATRRTSVIDVDPTTEVPHYTKPFSMSPFDAAVRLFVQKWDVTREQWVDFRSMLHLLQNVPPEVAALPARVDQKPSVTLIKREQRRQTIHLILGGAFKTSHPELTKCFQNVNAKCPSLFRYLTVPGTHLDCKQETNVDAQAIVNDPTHLGSAALKHIYPKSLRLKEDSFLSVIWPHRLSVQHPFRSALRDAYTEDYNIRNTQYLDKIAIQWAAAFRFVDS